MKTKIIIFLILISLFGSGCVINSDFGDYRNEKKVVFKTEKGDVAVNVEIARTPEETARGLMWRERLAEYSGMLFVFSDEAPRSFWMKNTLINLDIIFISKNKKIISIAENAIPCPSQAAGCPLYKSGEPAQYVVEVSGGFCKRHNIKKGTRLSLRFSL